MADWLLGNSESGKVCFAYKPFSSRGILVQGITGSGKTSLVAEVLKQNLGESATKPQQILFDKGPEFGRLRKHDPNYLIVGKDGEIPIAKEIAYKLGEIVRKKRVNVIIQIGSLKYESDQDEFIDKFIDGMMDVDDTNYWLPTIVVIDEAQQYCSSDGKSKCRDSIVRLLSEGRKYGFMSILMTQGIKDLYKNARKQLDNRIVGYTHEPDDRNLASELLMMSKKDSEQFIHLKAGEFLTWGSAITKETLKFRSSVEQISREEQFGIPKPSHYIVDLAKEIISEIQENVDVDETFKLQTKLSEKETRIKQIIEGTPIHEDVEAIRLAAYADGWNNSNETWQNAINHYNRISQKKRSFFGKKCNVKIVMGSKISSTGLRVEMPEVIEG